MPNPFRPRVVPLGILGLLALVLGRGAHAEEAPPAAQALDLATAVLSQFGEGAGPRIEGEVVHLLDAKGTHVQSNSIAFPVVKTSPREHTTLRGSLQVNKGGDGGAVVFLDAATYGARGPAPFAKSWVEPNFKNSFAVGIDVHNPKDEEMFSAWGNYRGMPQREVSLHFDGRELVKRVAPKEFRGASVPLAIRIEHVIGGAEVTVEVGGAAVYERYFVPRFHPHVWRLALGAGTRQDATTEFKVEGLALTSGPKAARPRPPLHVELFHHVMTNNQKTSYDTEVDLPPATWAFGRVVLNLDIHDGGLLWDEWDRNAELSLIAEDGSTLGLVPFITSYRTPCHWEVDVTHFRPYLQGKQRFRLAGGTNFYKGRGYLMSASLDFYPGPAKQAPFKVTPIWVGTAKYRSSENHFQDFFTPQDVRIDPETTSARLYTTTTGHSQVGEFTPSKRTFSVLGDVESESTEPATFEHVVWKDDVYLNPNRPQFGTWKFSRAGWSPGDIVWPWVIDVTPHIRPDKTARFGCTTYPYEFPEGRTPKEGQIHAASWVVRSYLVEYRDGSDLTTPPIVRVTGVAKDSNAAKAGMKRGDYLATYDGTKIDSVEDLRTALKAAVAAKKESVAVTVFRGVKQIKLTLQVGRMGVNLSH